MNPKDIWRNYIGLFLLGGCLALFAEHFLSIDAAFNDRRIENPLIAKVEAQSLHNETLQIQRVLNLSGSDQLLVICDFTNGHAYVMVRNSGGTDLEVIPDDCTKKNPH